jgi:hypothetical protein
MSSDEEFIENPRKKTRAEYMREYQKNYRQRNKDKIREQEKLRKQIQRLDEEYRQIEKERDTLNHQTRRSDPQYREIEKERDTSLHQIRRSDPKYREIEQERDTEQHRKKAHIQKNDENFLDQHYKLCIKEGPTYICLCCGLLCFRKNVKKFNEDKVPKNIDLKQISMAANKNDENNMFYLFKLHK